MPSDKTGALLDIAYAAGVVLGIVILVILWKRYGGEQPLQKVESTSKKVRDPPRDRSPPPRGRSPQPRGPWWDDLERRGREWDQLNREWERHDRAHKGRGRGGQDSPGHHDHYIIDCSDDDDGWFGSSSRDAQQALQRIAIRSDGGPDDAPDDDDSSRAFGGRIYSTAAMDPTIEREAADYARHMRRIMMYGDDHSPCNCAPESCRCAWGLRRARQIVGQGRDAQRYPEAPRRALPPEVGVEVGPLTGESWGVPEDYAMPGEDYAMPGEACWEGEGDHYGPEGPTVHAEDMYSLTEPDHVELS